MLRLTSTEEPTVGWERTTHRYSMTKLDVFLSHSGLQKDFVEQLYVDLKGASLNVFFDKESLIEGEEFPKSLHKAASKCKIAVAVLSEEFFTASSWPMAEIIASVKAEKPKIFPLYYLITPDVVRDAKKQEEWSAKWESWKMERHDMDLQQWKKTLKKIEITMGVEKKHFSEVEYRNKIVDRIKRTLEKINKKSDSEASSSGGPISGHISTGLADRSVNHPERSGASNEGAMSRYVSRGPAYRSVDHPGTSGTSNGFNIPDAIPQVSAPSFLRQFGNYFGAGIGIGMGHVGSSAVLEYIKPAKENLSTDVCRQFDPSYFGVNDFGPSDLGPCDIGPSNYGQSKGDPSGCAQVDPSNLGPSNYGQSKGDPSGCAQVGLQVGPSNILTGSRRSRGPPQVPAMCGACARIRLRVSSAIPLTSPIMPWPGSRCRECRRVFNLIQDWRPRRRQHSTAPIWGESVTSELYHSWTRRSR